MLEDVIRPPEPHSSFDMLASPVVLFDFTADDVFLAEALSNQLGAEVSTSNCSDDTLFSSFSPSQDSHRNPYPVVKPEVDFPAIFDPALPFNDQFDLSALQTFPSSSSPYEENASTSLLCFAFPQPAVGPDGPLTVPLASRLPFDTPFMDFAFGAVLPGGLGPLGSVDLRKDNPSLSLMQLISEDSVPGAPEWEMVRRLYRAGDIQVLHEKQLVAGGCGGTLTSEGTVLEETGLKVGRYSLEERKQRIHRYMKKRKERNFNKKIKYACRKTLADRRPRIRGRFAKNDEFTERTVANGMHPYENVENAEYNEQDVIDSSDIFADINGPNSFEATYPIQLWI